MNMKMLCYGAVALSMMTGAALAAGTSTSSSGSGSSALDKQHMAPFYTDDTMSTMKTGDDFTAAWKAMSPDDQTAMMTSCKDDMAGPKQYEAFCTGLGTAVGHGDGGGSGG